MQKSHARPLRWAIAAGVAAALSLATGAALAADAAQVIKERQDLMKKQGGYMKTIAGYVKEGKGTPDDVAKAAEGLAMTATEITPLFPEGTSMDAVMDPKTGAKADIWADWGKFEKAAMTLETEAKNLHEVAMGGDKDAIAGAFGQLGKNGCGGCHKPFRQKLEK
jgi:cytochrome c556